MLLALSAACTVVAEAAGLSLDHVKGIARRLQESKELPRSRGGRLPAIVDERHVAVLLLALLVPRPAVEAASLAGHLADFRHDGMRAADYISKLLLAAAGDGPTSTFVAHVSLTVHAGHALPRCAVVVRHACVDDPVEEAFTIDSGAWTPDVGGMITEARSLPGLLLHRIGRGIAEAANAA